MHFALHFHSLGFKTSTTTNLLNSLTLFTRTHSRFRHHLCFFCFVIPAVIFCWLLLAVLHNTRTFCYFFLLRCVNDLCMCCVLSSSRCYIQQVSVLIHAFCSSVSSSGWFVTIVLIFDILSLISALSATLNTFSRFLSLSKRV